VFTTYLTGADPLKCTSNSARASSLHSSRLFTLGVPRSTLRAQCSDPGSLWSAVTTLQGFADERRRIAQDLGRCSTNGELIRSSLSLKPRLVVAGPGRWAIAVPRIDATHNSALGLSLNDGPQWAGRDVTTTLSGGVRVETDSFSISIAPDIVFR
jgi:hypothetical protein